MFLSNFGTLMWVLICSTNVEFFPDYYYDGIWTLDQSVFWLSAFFLGPIMFLLIDLIGQAYRIFFDPTKDMIYREMSLENINMISSNPPSSERATFSFHPGAQN